jgi:hypothetical protein
LGTTGVDERGLGVTGVALARLGVTLGVRVKLTLLISAVEVLDVPLLCCSRFGLHLLIHLAYAAHMFVDFRIAGISIWNQLSFYFSLESLLEVKDMEATIVF